MKQTTMMRCIIILCLVVILIGCEFKTSKREWKKPFIATFNLDGSDVELMTSAYNNSFSYANPYFVRDLAGNGEEIILLEFHNKLDLMSLDGAYRRTILDSLSGVQYFNQERTKMLLQTGGEIYIVNVDGTELINLTNTPNIREVHPSFSYDEKSIVYTYSSNGNSSHYIVKLDLATQTTETLISLEGVNFPTVMAGFDFPAIIDENTLYYTIMWHDNSQATENYIRLMKVNLLDNSEETICSNVGYVKYSHNKEFLAYKWEEASIINLLTNEIIPLGIEYTDPHFSFSSSDRYLVMSSGVYDLEADIQYLFKGVGFWENWDQVDKVFMNLNEDRLIGMVKIKHD